MNLGNVEEEDSLAFDYFEKALKIQPDFVLAQENIEAIEKFDTTKN
jgi:hypothetical protein